MIAATFETLEGRRLLCGTVSTSTTPAAAIAPIATAARVAKSVLLAPSAVEGHYIGTATPNGSTDHLAISATITATSITLNAGAFGTGTVRLTAAQFKKLRSGVFSFSGKLAIVTTKLSGTVTKGGKLIKGTGSVDGKVSGDGTFSLSKA